MDMGVQLAGLFPGRPLDLRELSGKRVAIDAHNALHQFLAIIRQPDGEPLRDSKGRVTSVYSGLFYRTAHIMSEGVEPVYVFDGPPPHFKKLVIRERAEVRTRAAMMWEEALAEGDIKKARKYAQSALSLTSEIVASCKALLSHMGVPYVVAPSEGEAQAAVMAARGDVWAASSQDFDSLLFGAPRLVRNLTITGRRKLPNRDEYVEVQPLVVELPDMLSSLGIDQRQLIMLGMLVGTDYNQGGIPGIGPKKGLVAVRGASDPEEIMENLGWDHDVDFRGIFDFFLTPPFSGDYDIEQRPPDVRGVKRFLCEEFEFSERRVERALDQMRKSRKGRQTDLGVWA